MMQRTKFKIGDKVKLASRDTAWLFGDTYAGKFKLTDRKRARTVKRIVYDKRMKCYFYYLGDNNRSKPCFVKNAQFATVTELQGIGFRSYQLVKADGKRGRPRIKRKYERKARYNLNTIIPEMGGFRSENL